jgi:hypothetical protein
MKTTLLKLTPRASGTTGTLALVFGTLLASPLWAADATPSEKAALQQLRQEISALKQDYQQRMAQLEARLAAAEEQLQAAESAKAAPAPATDSYAALATGGSASQSANAFNPAISLIMDGRYVDYTSRPDSGYLPGFRYNPEYGLDAEGFHIGESELTLSANVDDKFYGQATIALGNEDGETVTEVEEAFVQTTALGHGLTAKFGRHFSALGYLNEQHPHAWDFADRPLVYSALLGGTLKNEGIQLTWLLPTDFYLESGIELGNGQPFPAAGNHNGFSAQTAFLTTGSDIGFSHSWQAGLSWWHGKSDAAAVNGSGWDFAGDSYLTALDLVYKWAPMGNTKEKNFKLQFEYLRNRDNGQLLAGDELHQYAAHRDGWYAQAVWQFRPLWRTGLRYDRVKAGPSGSLSSPMPWLTDSGLFGHGDAFHRVSAMLEWIPSEFSRLRLQYNAPLAGGGSAIDAASVEDAKWTFQYTVSMGSHGAHQY